MTTATLTPHSLIDLTCESDLDSPQHVVVLESDAEWTDHGEQPVHARWTSSDSDSDAVSDSHTDSTLCEDSTGVGGPYARRSAEQDAAVRRAAKVQRWHAQRVARLQRAVRRSVEREKRERAMDEVAEWAANEVAKRRRGVACSIRRAPVPDENEKLEQAREAAFAAGITQDDDGYNEFILNYCNASESEEESESEHEHKIELQNKAEPVRRSGVYITLPPGPVPQGYKEVPRPEWGAGWTEIMRRGPEDSD